jgi:shikimate kinase
MYTQRDTFPFNQKHFVKTDIPMTRTKSNIILIGMPGSGKSTVGVILAKLAGRGFIDTDILIQTATERSLQDIVDTDGQMALRRIEEEILMGISCREHVIATGGSAVYSDRAMAHLRSDGVIVFLEADIAILQSRVNDFTTRGLAKQAGQTFADLFAERAPLYARYADITINCSGLTHEEVCVRIIDELGLYDSEPE